MEPIKVTLPKTPNGDVANWHSEDIERVITELSVERGEVNAAFRTEALLLQAELDKRALEARPHIARVPQD